MITEEQIVNLCVMSLSYADEKIMTQIASYLIDPLYFHIVRKVISNPYVSFSFCLALKQNFKKEKSSRTYLKL